MSMLRGGENGGIGNVSASCKKVWRRNSTDEKKVKVRDSNAGGDREKRARIVRDCRSCRAREEKGHEQGYWKRATRSERGADEDGGGPGWGGWSNQNVFQLILQLRSCSLALAHTRDDIASSATRVINIMMTDWRSCGTPSAPWQLGLASVTWPARHHLTSFNMAASGAGDMARTPQSLHTHLALPGRGSDTASPSIVIPPSFIRLRATTQTVERKIKVLLTSLRKMPTVFKRHAVYIVSR